MGSTTPHGLPYPVGTDRIMDGDNAIQALAEAVDTALWAGAAAGAPAPGIWAPATGTVICTDTTLTAQPGTTVAAARYMKIGRTVWFNGEASTSTAVSNAAISLPNALAGVPYRRQLCAGMLIQMATGAIATQTYHGMMNTNLNAVVMAYVSGGYITLPAGCTMRWNLTYETAT